MFNRKITARLLLLILLAFPVLVSGETAVLVPGPQHAKSTTLIVELVKNYHYSHPELNDEVSSLTLERFIKSLDPNRHFFLALDIQSFEKYRYKLDDAIRDADTTAAFEIYNIFRLRVEQRVKQALVLLDQPYDFSVDESYRIDYEDFPWAASDSDLDELWRKRIKNDILNLRLAGKTKEKIQDTLKKRYERLLRRTHQQRADDVYQLFINAYTNTLDPHTSYFSPHNSENFNINMRLSLEGIGAALRMKNEYTQVQRIISGGPADISGQLHSGDKIIGVAQDQAEMVDVIGWRLQDVVELIRGPKDSVVRLLLQPYRSGADGPTREITLVRDKINLEQQAAKSSIIEDIPGNPGIKIGVIDIPTFYLDFDARARHDDDYRSTTRDVRKLIEQLKDEDVDGIVVDLRGNGGGSLSESTELTGLFIRSGPVVQIKGTRGNIEVNHDPDPGITYEGPLAVLVDRFSASASEIFAGAIQDYRRGIIIGEPTFGKGTVQTLINLNRFNDGKTNLGQLKVTIAQFFRINGSSTQHRGVRPDIVYPTAVDTDDHGERSLDNALPWAMVKAASYKPVVSSWYDLEILRNQHKSRIVKDPGFIYLVDTAREIKTVRAKKVVSLLESRRREERNQRREKNLQEENLFRQSRGLKLLTMADKDKDKDEDEVFDEDEKDNPIIKIQLQEAANILADHVIITGDRYAVNRKSK